MASASPRREQLLRQLGVSFTIESQDILEEQKLDEAPLAFVKRMADEKAQAALANRKDNDVVVLAADTIVLSEDQVMGKPKNKRDAVRMLLSLSGKEHRVLSALTMASPLRQKSAISDTVVEFREISEIEADYYWESGEPQGKAGAYAIQGFGAVFVRAIKGSYSGVMGLPLFETAQLLEEFSIPCWQVPLHSSAQETDQ